jgi:hypothetical protein
VRCGYPVAVYLNANQSLFDAAPRRRRRRASARAAAAQFWRHTLYNTLSSSVRASSPARAPLVGAGP